jgi:hypothetical protein
MSTYPKREPRRILVVANETVESPAILETLLERRDNSRGEASEVMVVVPALNTRLRYWMLDLDQARMAAQWRLMRSLDALREAGVVAEGCVGDADPFLAMTDVLAVFPADEIVIATHPEHRSNWLARDLPAHARAAFPQPVRHIVVEVLAHELTRAAA